MVWVFGIWVNCGLVNCRFWFATQVGLNWYDCCLLCCKVSGCLIVGDFWDLVLMLVFFFVCFCVCVVFTLSLVFWLGFSLFVRVVVVVKASGFGFEIAVFVLFVCFVFKDIVWYFGFALLWVVVLVLDLFCGFGLWVGIVVYYLRSFDWCVLVFGCFDLFAYGLLVLGVG